MRYLLLCLLIFFNQMQLAKLLVAVQIIVWAIIMVLNLFKVHSNDR